MELDPVAIHLPALTCGASESASVRFLLDWTPVDSNTGSDRFLAHLSSVLEKTIFDCLFALQPHF